MTALRPVTKMFDAAKAREDFPILKRQVHGKPLVFLDSAASAQKPQVVIDSLANCLGNEYANIHRGVYYLSGLSTKNFEAARETVQRFINARESREIIFTRGATESINLVANSWGGANLKPGDEILVSMLEHHSNIVPWQLVAQRTGARVVAAPIDDNGDLILEEFLARLSSRTRIVAITHVSNALGTITPLQAIIEAAHARGIPVLVDGCQGIVHREVDVQALDCDFYAFSGHKLYGPTGIGVLYGKAALLSAMPPYQGGGEMIETVSFEGTTYAGIPHRFEAGTPPIAEAIALGTAIDYVTGFDRAAILAHEESLLEHTLEALRARNDVTLVGMPKKRASIVSFTMNDIHPHDVGTILDQTGVAVRVGHHCAQPLMDRFAIPGTIRASFGLYNTKADVDALVDGLAKVREIFG